MKIILFLFFSFFIQILSDDEGESTDYYTNYKSPCEKIENPNSFEDCIGKSCEYIEEKCCYLESKNHTTNENKKECIDFYFYDYMRDDLKHDAIEAIKNGSYWDVFNETYDEIISLRCESEFLLQTIFLYILILFF